MKSILCILAALCVLHASALNPLDGVKNNIQKAKSNLNTQISDLQRTKNRIEQSVQTRLSNLKSQQMMNINNFVNPALSDIRAKVDAAKNAGKDAEHCYTNAQASLRTVSMTGFSSLTDCEKSAIQSFQPHVNRMDGLIQLANQPRNELDRVMLDCYNNNIMQMATCASIKVGTINQNIRAWESTVSNAKREAESGGNDAVLKGNSCFLTVMSTARMGNTEAILASNTCLNNA